MVDNIVNEPITFLGATVISTSSTVGFGSNESSLSVELVEDCNLNQVFLPKVNSNYSVGCPVSIQIGDFFFGGFLSNWTENLGSNGYTISATITDPRSVLDNTTVISDSYMDVPVVSTNYVNVYHYWEGSILYTPSCVGFGITGAANRGMPYKKIIEALQNINPIVLTSTGFPYQINWSTFLGAPSFAGVDINGVLYGFNNSTIPDFYRVPGPASSILQLLQGVCDLLGLEFFVYVTNNYVINIGYVDLKNPPGSFVWIKDKFSGIATDISYGQELRNEKTKNFIIGEQQHYMSVTKFFDHFFGEDRYGTNLFPVIPFTRNECGFWINKRIDSLNIQLDDPFLSNGPFWLSELDIRTAMASFNLWQDRVMATGVLYNDNPRTLNYQIRDKFPEGAGCNTSFLESLNRGLDATGESQNQAAINMGRAVVDSVHIPNKPVVNVSLPIKQKQIETIHQWVKNLGDTYYGKQFITKLNQKICKNYAVPGDPTSEPVFSDIPTGAGGWVDYGIPVLGLSEPELQLFREDDHRLSCFVRFDITPPGEEITDPEPSGGLNGLFGPDGVISGVDFDGNLDPYGPIGGLA